MTFAVEKGRYHADPKRSKCMTVIYYSSVTGKPYMMGLKVIGSGEVWVATFHHTNQRKIKQRVGKWKVLREHDKK